MVKFTKKVTEKQTVNSSIKKRKTQNKRLYKNKTKHSKVRIGKKYKGGIVTENVVDSNDLLTYYLRKKIIGNSVYNNILKFNEEVILGENTLLMVIDMQNDFVDRMMDNDKPCTLTGPTVPINLGDHVIYGNIGAFAVNNGVSIIPSVVELVKDVLSNNGKVVFSRDVHTCDHCSFEKKGEHCDESKPKPNGIFPPHCIAGTPGSGLVKEIKECIEKNIKEGKKLGNISDDRAADISVIFKGCSQDTDSFGAFPYLYNNSDNPGDPKPSDLKTRSNPTCLSANKDNTGGFYIDPIDPDKESILDDDYDPTKESLSKKHFTIPENIKQIYLVGLAGDYCVCDTAINMAKQLKTLPDGNKCSVNMLYDLTRNAFIPFSDVKFFPNNLTPPDSNKGLQDYIFRYNGKYTTLDATQLKELKEKIDNKIDFNTYDYWHFLTDIKDLFNNYLKAGVSVIINNKTITKNETVAKSNKPNPNLEIL